MENGLNQQQEAILDSNFELFHEIFEKKQQGENYDCILNKICEQSGCTKEECEYISQEHIKWLQSPLEESPVRYEDTRPRCPTCSSTDIKKISAVSKVGSVALWGIFSQKVKKQFHCNHCGYEW